MKNRIYILCLIAFMISFMVVSCTAEQSVTVGKPDNPSTYGVYFPMQSNSGEIVLDEDEPCVLTFKVSRTKTDDAITVPFIVRSDDEDVFSVSEIVFGEEEAYTEFTVSFPSARYGRTYECTVLVNDPLYVSFYTSMANHISFKVTRVRQ